MVSATWILLTWSDHHLFLRYKCVQLLYAYHSFKCWIWRNKSRRGVFDYAAPLLFNSVLFLEGIRLNIFKCDKNTIHGTNARKKSTTSFSKGKNLHSDCTFAQFILLTESHLCFPRSLTVFNFLEFWWSSIFTLSRKRKTRV